MDTVPFPECKVLLPRYGTEKSPVSIAEHLLERYRACRCGLFKKNQICFFCEYSLKEKNYLDDYTAKEVTSILAATFSSDHVTNISLLIQSFICSIHDSQVDKSNNVTFHAEELSRLVILICSRKKETGGAYGG